jgi:hypothetical protein
VSAREIGYSVSGILKTFYVSSVGILTSARFKPHEEVICSCIEEWGFIVVADVTNGRLISFTKLGTAVLEPTWPK